jgi:hypothetical protein
MERAGLLAVGVACNELNLIWRDLLQEDVGVDGTIEVAIDEFPSGKLVGAQVKSGTSYIHAETEASFKFYPRTEDLEYWSRLSIPLILFVHNPHDGNVYWVDITRTVHEQAQNHERPAHIEFRKTDIINDAFELYLRGMFDLAVHNDEQLGALRAELERITHAFGDGEAEVVVSALDLFIEGLWGLCSKVQFHTSLLTSIIRRELWRRRQDFFAQYTFSRSSLYPFLTDYFRVLSKHHLASIDVSDVNQSLYAKLEVPTFVAPLTTNGRRFVESLRAAGIERARDNQFFTLALIPHEQIEVYQSFALKNGKHEFGPFTDVLSISFNPYLDYYRLEHWHRIAPDKPAQKIVSQTSFYFELIEYVERVLANIPKDNILLRHQDLPLSPFICWLEDWYGAEGQSFPASGLEHKTNAELAGFNDEMTSIMAGVGVISVSEPPYPDLPIRSLFNGEVLET